MRLKEKSSGAFVVTFSRKEGALLGLYDGLADGKRAPEVDRGLGTYHPDEANEIVKMLEAFFEHLGKKTGALQFLQEVVRDQTRSFTEALRLWLQARERVGKNAEKQMDYVLTDITKVRLAPLVTVWGGGNASVGQRKRNLSAVRRFIPVNSDMTADEFTDRAVDRHLKALLKEPVHQSCGELMTKEGAVRHRGSIRLFAEWLLTGTAANAANLPEGQYVIESNPVDRAKDPAYTPQKGEAVARQEKRVWYTQEECKRLIMAAEGELRPLLALMFGSAVEMGAVFNADHTKGKIGPVLFKRDFRRHADGPEKGEFNRWFNVAGIVNRGDPSASQLKTPTRTRALEIPDAEGFSFYWDIVKAHLDGLDKNAPFLSHHYEYYRFRMIRAIQRVGLTYQPGYLFHPARHSFAQHWLPLALANPKGKRNLDWLKQQLGHTRESTLLLTRYTKSLRTEGEGVREMDENLSQKLRGVRAS